MKEIMKDGNHVKNCVKFCTKDGLLKRLEKI